jgi:glutaconyl-CoA/methylmalonyl-CoA decarboxylase subunit gamma
MPNYRVTVDGHEYLVEVPDPSERPVRAIIDGEVLEVAISSGTPNSQDGTLSSRTARTAVSAQPIVAVPTVASAQPARSSGGPGGAIKAPLPGTIVGISVAVGEAFTHGQELCVLEAMKMNNPIRATRAGTVREIRISIGQQVQHGTVLMVVDET